MKHQHLTPHFMLN